MLHDLIINPKKHSKKTDTMTKRGYNSVEKEFLAFAQDIAKYYPEALSNKNAFLNHMTQYIQQGLKDWLQTKK